MKQWIPRPARPWGLLSPHDRKLPLLRRPPLWQRLKLRRRLSPRPPCTPCRRRLLPARTLRPDPSKTAWRHVWRGSRRTRHRLNACWENGHVSVTKRRGNRSPAHADRFQLFFYLPSDASSARFPTAYEIPGPRRSTWSLRRTSCLTSSGTAGELSICS